MAVSSTLEYANIEDLCLDPMNPRLGRHRMSRDTSQEELLNTMRAWVLDEIAYSYLQSGGFWTHEPLIVVKEELYGAEHLVVVEGNRRLAALKYLFDAANGNPYSRIWGEMIDELRTPEGLFGSIPYVLADTRADVQAFLGFRHVTGIKQWGADEKAGFIAKLIDEQDLSYKEVARKIGSKVPTVRKHYIAYQLMLQIENFVEDIDTDSIGDRFAVLYMSVDTQGVQTYLNIDITKPPNQLNEPVPREQLKHLENFAKWLFGLNDVEPIITDTRQVSKFGKILENQDAIEYLETSKKPKFEVAYTYAGGEEDETINYIQEAYHNVELALSRVHLYKKSIKLSKEVKRLGTDVKELLKVFPEIMAVICAEE